MKADSGKRSYLFGKFCFSTISRLTALIGLGVLLFACANPREFSRHETPEFPLRECAERDDSHCLATLFPPEADPRQRQPTQFPLRYLEIYDSNVRDAHCATEENHELETCNRTIADSKSLTPGEKSSDCIRMASVSRAACIRRLESLAGFFFRDGRRPEKSEIGLALEGGGTKAAPFALGALAALHDLELLPARVTAISSVSGGSYAASYYFNRLYDSLKPHDAGDTSAAKTHSLGHDDQCCTETKSRLSTDRNIVATKNTFVDGITWFRSCLPDYFAEKNSFQYLRHRLNALRCWEKTNDPLILERNGVTKRFNPFSEKYEFLGHVWMNHDLLRGSATGNLRTESELGTSEIGNLALLTVETAVTVPFQFLARSIFRWPLNSAPTKLAYKLGLERQYGYSPRDWHEAGDSDFRRSIITVIERRKTRTLSDLRRRIDIAEVPAPAWIINTTAPGEIGPIDWLEAPPRDPVRQQFEITWNGYGSGNFGYAKLPPEALFDFLGPEGDGLAINDAVVASAAFLDEDQSKVSAQPFRLLAGIGQHFANLTWFSEIRNFRASNNSRFVSHFMPWPLYLTATTNPTTNGFIHLQDGGNAENSGVMPLLRRGYNNIVYVHGTTDRYSQFEDICHLKNQLELDGSYFVRSADIEKLYSSLMDKNSGNSQRSLAVPGGREFETYLDALCSNQLSASDLSTFDENPHREQKDRAPSVAKLYCGRLGDKPSDRSVPDPLYSPCPEFQEKFSPAARAKKYSPIGVTDLFFRLPASTQIVFNVYQGDALDYIATKKLLPPEPFAHVIAVVPGHDWSEVRNQLFPPRDSNFPSMTHDWDYWCAKSAEDREKWVVNSCEAPDGRTIRANIDGESSPRIPIPSGLPCIALAHTLEDRCVRTNGSRHPEFPQDDLVSETLHTTYTAYAAYFDLGRFKTRNALCGFLRSIPDKQNLPNGCYALKEVSDMH